MQQVFESWNLAPRPLWPRSRLYSPAPEGMGTAFVESLSGYVVRLAETHAVSTGDLVHRELSRHVSSPLIFPNSSQGINGLEKGAARWVEAVEAATLRSDLRYLTLLPFKTLFPSPLLLRKIRAWCPECYADMAGTGTVYEPLLWCLKLVEACPRHRRLLATTCSCCQQPLRPLYAAARTGRCSRCAMQLECNADGTADGTSNPVPTKYQLWVADAMGQLLAHARVVRPKTLPDRVRGVLAAYTEAFAEDNRAAVAKAVQCDRNVFYAWFKGDARPRVDSLLRAWYQLKLPVSLIFSQDGALLGEEKGQTTVKIARALKVPPRRTREQIQRALREVLNGQPPPSLTEVARRLGYTKSTRLRDADPVVCAQIATNYRRSGHWNWWRKRGAKPICELSQVKIVLEDHLRAEGRIPPLHRIAVSLGYASDGSIWEKFPELCRALSAKSARQKAERVAAIKPALERALQENPPPTIREVCQRIGLSASRVRRVHAPALCEKLMARHREFAQARRAELLDTLKGILNEAPPPPPKEVYTRLGMTVSIATYNFPELRRAIIVRYRQYRHQQAWARQEAGQQEIRAIVRSLHEQAVYPSVGRVRSLLKCESLVKWAVLGKAVKDARKELFSPQLD